MYFFFVGSFLLFLVVGYHHIQPSNISSPSHGQIEKWWHQTLDVSEYECDKCAMSMACRRYQMSGQLMRQRWREYQQKLNTLGRVEIVEIDERHRFVSGRRRHKKLPNLKLWLVQCVLSVARPYTTNGGRYLSCRNTRRIHRTTPNVFNFSSVMRVYTPRSHRVLRSR